MPDRPVTIPKSAVTIPERAVMMGRNTHLLRLVSIACLFGEDYNCARLLFVERGNVHNLDTIPVKKHSQTLQTDIDATPGSVLMPVTCALSGSVMDRMVLEVFGSPQLAISR
jgi:hypothetical protein